MSKLTYKDKLEIIKLKEQGISGLKYHVHDFTVYKIIKLYGKDALKVKKYHKVYSDKELIKQQQERY